MQLLDEVFLFIFFICTGGRGTARTGKENPRAKGDHGDAKEPGNQSKTNSALQVCGVTNVLHTDAIFSRVFSFFFFHIRKIVDAKQLPLTEPQSPAFSKKIRI